MFVCLYSTVFRRGFVINSLTLKNESTVEVFKKEGSEKSLPLNFDSKSNSEKINNEELSLVINQARWWWGCYLNISIFLFQFQCWVFILTRRIFLCVNCSFRHTYAVLICLNFEGNGQRTNFILFCYFSNRTTI